MAKRDKSGVARNTACHRTPKWLAPRPRASVSAAASWSARGKRYSARRRFEEVRRGKETAAGTQAIWSAVASGIPRDTAFKRNKTEPKMKKKLKLDAFTPISPAHAAIPGRTPAARVAALALALVLARPAAAAEVAGFDIHGFVDARAGRRLQEDPVERGTSLAEIRAQIAAERRTDLGTLMLRADFVYDAVPRASRIDLKTGEGWLDLREANGLFSPVSWADIKIGRQILTWGVGDMLFVNDLFPKDWRAYFIGRDTDYLKAPSDALLISLFPGPVDLDIVYTPQFDPDRYICGSRLSYWNPMLGRRAGRDAVADPETPGDWFSDDEIALRARRTIGGWELALYGYEGFWKSPEGFNPVTARARFPTLGVYGVSARGGLAGGLVSFEAAQYDSREDRDGRDPFVPNSQKRLLVGYEREIARNLQASVQYYAEIMDDAGAYRATLPTGMHPRDDVRQVVTLRLTRLALNQNLTLSLFLYVSPSDRDGYLRPAVTYKATDDWLFAAGANLFFGRDDHTFFGQFEKNNNIYVAVRRSF